MASPITAEVLPVELRLSAPPTMPQARSYMFKQQSDLQEYIIEPGTCIKINLPRLQQTYLTKDSYIRFKFNIDVRTNVFDEEQAYTQAGLWFDRIGALGLFDRIEVYDYLGGTLLERITDVPMLMTLLSDLESPLLTNNGTKDAVMGGRGAMTTYGSTAASGSSTNAFDPVIVKSSPTGRILLNQKSITYENSPIEYNTSIEFCIPVVSFLGIFSDKFVPLHNGFTLNLYCNSINNALVSRWQADQLNPDTLLIDNAKATIVSSWLTNIEFCAQVIELDSVGESLVMSGNGDGPWIVPSKQYRIFKQQINQGESSFRLDMNLNVVSLRNVRFTMHPLLYLNDLSFPYYGTRIRNFLQRFNFQYGSSYLPELAGIVCRGINVPGSKNGFSSLTAFNKTMMSTQGYVELIKTADNKWSSAFKEEIPISLIEYNIDLASNCDSPTSFDQLTSDVYRYAPCYRDDRTRGGKFAGGIDLRLNNKAIVSGIDTNGLLVSLNGQFDTDYLNKMITCILHAYAEYDAFVQIIPGVATTVTF